MLLQQTNVLWYPTLLWEQILNRSPLCVWVPVLILSCVGVIHYSGSGDVYVNVAKLESGQVRSDHVIRAVIGSIIEAKFDQTILKNFALARFR